MSYTAAILWFMSFPVCILVSYCLVILALKKFGKYHPVNEEQEE